MAEFWTIKWIEYIVASYAIVGVVICGLIIWVLVTYSTRKRDLARLEKQGLKRAASNDR